ncbi:hypothetical protein JRO89_XS02G0165200 [Xanthoceras sorbifolium]|uniref:Reverse transcriptase zinc-binding domain-containing protein n=1 Tax=Xanthoceras sorbifolium TaxID=99658 RepID=A0ABQ8IGR9_9ROSI|nr:hypothetical protein JRO89_XS02G0165200 [Xanthoceras sorbifolium]
MRNVLLWKGFLDCYAQASGKSSERELLGKGIRRVGKGSDVFVYRDKWMPRPYSFVVIISPSILGEQLVKDLKMDSGGWDVDKLVANFFHDDVIHKVSVHDLCLLCNWGTKSTFHALWGCSTLKDIRHVFDLAKGEGAVLNFSFLDLMLWNQPQLKVADL